MKKKSKAWPKATRQGPATNKAGGSRREGGTVCHWEVQEENDCD